MSTDNDFADDETTTPDTGSEDVATGVTNEPRGNGDRDDAAVEAGEDKLGQAGAGH